jgi:hypothetical protein
MKKVTPEKMIQDFVDWLHEKGDISHLTTEEIEALQEDFTTEYGIGGLDFQEVLEEFWDMDFGY